MIDTQEHVSSYILIAVDTGFGDVSAEDSVNELASLLDTAGGREAGRIIQSLDKPNTHSYLGKGKLEELKILIRQEDADGIVADDELSPAQLKCLADELGVEVLDRTLLILEIFSQRAKTKEGQLQVELARLQYKLTRLTGLGVSMSRQGGGAGLHARGAGETQLELDRRYIRQRIELLNEQLDQIETQRELQRKRRQKNQLPMIALIGYTNAGKSTLFNRYTEAGVLEENKLFATLDITTRRMELPSGRQILLADTVGFIQKLPHNLVKAFHATLEEVVYADLLVHVVDASDPKADSNGRVTMREMQELGAGGKPVILVLNKQDLVQEPMAVVSQDGAEDTISISAFNEADRQELLLRIDKLLDKQFSLKELLLPYDKQALLSRLHESAQILEEEYRNDGVYIKAQLGPRDLGLVQAYILG